MKFDLKNIGPIKEASIKVDGLTVIAGENSIGKSAIGKAIFCLVKSGLPTIPTQKMINYCINNIFNQSINNQLNNKDAFISITNNESFINVKIANNKYKNHQRHNFSFLDATIIETPLILSLFKFIRDSLAFNHSPLEKNKSNRDNLPYQTFDLVRKLFDKSSFKEDRIYKDIEQIISGRIEFDNKKDDFTFFDKKNLSFDINNVASGIKSFGLIQILLSSGHLMKDNILIIDEPEVHLHPFWQIEYAKVLVKLAENNIPVVVASHSPYFIEALKTYSDKTIKDKTNFYLGEMQEGGSVFKDVTDDLEPIFELLSIPMQQLMLANH